MYSFRATERFGKQWPVAGTPACVQAVMPVQGHERMDIAMGNCPATTPLW